MREVTMYYSFDDKEFDSYDECYKYEKKIEDYMREIMSLFVFYDRNMKQINYYFENLMGILCSFDWGWQNCMYIEKISDCSKEALNFIKEYFGYPLPDEIGLNKYDWIEYKWVKVSG